MNKGKPVDNAKRPGPRPETVAASFQAMREKAREALARNQERIRLSADPAFVRDMALPDVKKLMTRTQLDIALFHLAGMSIPQIMVQMGTQNRRLIHSHLARPSVRRFIELVDQARIERVIAGEYGVRAQAKAAAPKVMEQVIAKAGGARDETRMARRDADAIRAADLVLTVAGEKVERSEHHHVHDLVASLTMDELRHLGDTGEFPERLQRTVGALGIGPAKPVLDVTPDTPTPEDP